MLFFFCLCRLSRVAETDTGVRELRRTSFYFF
jgi:hypothetical protein